MPNSGNVPLGAFTVPVRVVNSLPIDMQSATSQPRPSQPCPKGTHCPLLVHSLPVPHSPPVGVHRASHLPVDAQKKPVGQVSRPDGSHAELHAAGGGTSRVQMLSGLGFPLQAASAPPKS